MDNFYNSNLDYHGTNQDKFIEDFGLAAWLDMLDTVMNAYKNDKNTVHDTNDCNRDIPSWFTDYWTQPYRKFVKPKTDNTIVKNSDCDDCPFGDFHSNKHNF